MAPEAGSKQRVSGADVAKGLLEEVLTEEFFEKHWEREPLHYRAAERGRKANRLPEALTVDDVMALIRCSGPSLKVFKRGEPSHLDSFMMAYLDGASLIVNQADRCNETLFSLCLGLADSYFHHAFGVVYLTPPGSQAVRLHNDDQDVFLLQVWGRKNWTIRNAPKLLPYTEEMLGKDAPVPQELVGEPVMQFTIEPHDVLYIPRGYLHEAATGEEPSLHITVTVPTSDYCWGVQLVKHFMHQLHSQELPEPPFGGASLCGRGAGGDEALDGQLRELLAKWAKGVTPENVIGAYEKRMAATNEGQRRQFERISEVRPGGHWVMEESRVRLMPGVTCTCEPGSDIVVFMRETDGRHMEMPVARSSVPLVTSLTHRPQWVRDLPCEDAFERVCVLQLLHQQGVVQLFLRGPGDRSEGA